MKTVSTQDYSKVVCCSSVTKTDKDSCVPPFVFVVWRCDISLVYVHVDPDHWQHQRDRPSCIYVGTYISYAP